MWCLGSPLFFFCHLPPPPPPPDLALFAPDCRCMAHRASLFLFFLPYWLYFPPRGGPLGEAPRSSCFWSVCSPRGRNGADSLIPDEIVFAFALFCLFSSLFCHCIPRGVWEEGTGREGSMGWMAWIRSTPTGFGFGFAIQGVGLGAIYIYTIHWSWGFSFFVVGLFIVSSIGLNVVPCNLIRAALGPGEGALDCSGVV